MITYEKSISFHVFCFVFSFLFSFQINDTLANCVYSNVNIPLPISSNVKSFINYLFFFGDYEMEQQSQKR